MKKMAKKLPLPELEIVERLLTTRETIRTLASEYGCHNTTINTILGKHTTREQRQQAKCRKQGQTLSSKPIEQRFWPNVKAGKPDECWEWIGGKTGDYGSVKINRTWTAHRLSYHLHHPEWPINSPDFVLHKCDNRICVNPNHLFLGTHLDNVADMKRKGRAAKGEVNGNSKLITSQVIEIKKLLKQQVSQAFLARHFRVSASLISEIYREKIWTHVRIDD